MNFFFKKKNVRRNLEGELIRDFENPEEVDTPGDWKEYTANIADSQPVKISWGDSRF